MKKYLFLAATAFMFAACTNNEAEVPQITENGPQAVAFDTYTASATRAGQTEVMTTTTLQATGFGVFAQQSNDGEYSKATEPVANFMWNQKVTYSSGAWAYNPIKYWPNETTHDSQTSDGYATSLKTDLLSFFAYAPYVQEHATANKDGYLNAYSYTAKPTKAASNIETGVTPTGITSIIGNSTKDTDPFVRYAVSSLPSGSVDLLWGVAPAGGLTYTAVNGVEVTRAEGTPLINLTKPAKDQKIKFLFKHALARLGMTVVAAVDQIAPGGTLKEEETKINIKSITITETTTNLKTTGALNLNNTTAGVSLWEETDGAINFVINKDKELNRDLWYTTDAATTFEDTQAKGVTTKEKTVIAQGGSGTVADPYFDRYFMVIPGHANTQLKVNIVYSVITKDANVSGGYVETINDITKKVTINNLTNNKAYNLKLILGLTSVKLDAEVADWQVDGSTEVNLPRNNE